MLVQDPWHLQILQLFSPVNTFSTFITNRTVAVLYSNLWYFKCVKHIWYENEVLDFHNKNIKIIIITYNLFLFAVIGIQIIHLGHKMF